MDLIYFLIKEILNLIYIILYLIPLLISQNLISVFLKSITFFLIILIIVFSK